MFYIVLFIALMAYALGHWIVTKALPVSVAIGGVWVMLNLDVIYGLLIILGASLLMAIMRILERKELPHGIARDKG